MKPSQALKEIAEKCPGLLEVFPENTHEVFNYSSPIFDEIEVSQLTHKITYLFEINETPLILRYFPGKGWSAGTELPSGMEGMKFELLASDGPFRDDPGSALLELLHTCVTECGFQPVCIKRKLHRRKKDLARQH